MDEARAYKPKKIRNIAELDTVETNLQLSDATLPDIKDPSKTVTIKVIEKNGEKFRVPVSVIKQLKVLLEDEPQLKYFKVRKSGTEMSNTEYFVIPVTNKL